MKTKLSELCKIQYGYAFDSDKFTDDDKFLPLVRIRDVKRGYSETYYDGKYPNEYIIHYGDLLIGMDGEFNIARWKSREALLNQRVCRIAAKPGTNEEYLRFALTKALKEIENRTAFVTVKHLSAKELNKLELNIPELEKQNIIAKTLSKLESIIGLKNREVEFLDNLIKARFVEMFGDPLNPNKANCYFTKCVEFNPQKAELNISNNLTVSFVPMECVGVDGSFSIKENGDISNYYKGYTYFRNGDVLLAKITPCFENGKVAIAQGCTNGIGFGTTEFHVSRPISGTSNSCWIKYLLKNDRIHDLATVNMTGSAGQKRIQKAFFDKLKIYVPPITQQNEFASFVQQVDKSKVAVQKSLEQTQMLFDSLMQQYFG